MPDEDEAINTAETLHTAIEALKPIFEAAKGIKADLEREGWSPTVAESIAHQWVLNVLNQIWSK